MKKCRILLNCVGSISNTYGLRISISSFVYFFPSNSTLAVLKQRDSKYRHLKVDHSKANGKYFRLIF
jgi:hypothetical protein